MRQEAAYARQSMEKRGSLSISGQLELCRKAAGGELVTYADRGYSGKNTVRPDFQKLIRDIKADQISKLYVYRLDRFSRSIADFGQLWELLHEHGVEFVSVTENFDTSTPMGRAMLHIIMVFAQLERETTSERVKDNYRTRAALGRWPGGPAPYGFTLGRSVENVPMLFVKEAEKEIVEWIFRSYAAEGATLGSLLRELNRQGIPCAKRDCWDNVSLSRLLHNPVYVRADEQVRLYYQTLGVEIVTAEEGFDGQHGAFLYGKRQANSRKYTSLTEHRLSVLLSDGFIPSELWLRVQDKLAHNTHFKNSGKGKYTWLGGLMKCKKCGYAIRLMSVKPRRTLGCSGRYNMAHCDAAIKIDLDELENVVAAEIQQLLDEGGEDNIEIEEKDPYAEKIAAVERRMDRLLDAFAANESMDRSALHRAMGRLEKEKSALEAQQKKEKNRPKIAMKLDFAALSLEEKKLVARRYIERIELLDDTAEIKWLV